MLKRVREGHEVESGAMTQVPEAIREVANAIGEMLLEDFHINIPAAECIWLYPVILSNSNIAVRTVDTTHLKDLTGKIISFIHQSYGFDLEYDQVLAKGLFDHLKSVFESRGTGGESISYTPFLKTIKASLPLAFEIALAASNEVLNGNNHMLSEGEIGYIALHIGAAIERKRVAPSSKLNVLVVCDAGKAAQQLLKTRAELLFSDKIKIVGGTSRQELILRGEEMLENIDLILTTSPIRNISIPYLTVDFRLVEDDVKLITHWLESSTSAVSGKVRQFFDPNLFFYIDSPISRDDLLEKMCAAVVKTGTTDRNLWRLVSEREELSSTAIGPCVAIPHPVSLCSTETRVAVAILKEGISWSPVTDNDHESEQVRIVFLLSMQPGISSEIELLYDLILKISSNETLQHAIQRSRSVEQLLSALDESMN